MTAGEVLGDYRLVSPLGRGGMAEVWRAVRISTGQPVAIKCLLPRWVDDADIRSRFEREGQIRIDHKHAVQIQDYITVQDRPAIVMKLYTGGSLDARIRPPGAKGRPILLDEVWTISRQILSALDYAHSEAKVIHRDVKPANILFDENGDASLADFGIALDMKRYDQTRVGGELGSPSYMSPEQVLRPGRVRHLADVYSFGCVLFDMLTGRPPFVCDENDSDAWAFTIKQMHLSQEPPRPTTLNRNFPPLIELILLWSLVKREEDRLPGGGTFIQSLDVAQNGSWFDKAVLATKLRWTLAQARSTPKERDRARKFRWAAIIVLAGVLFALVRFVPWPNRAPIETSPPIQSEPSTPPVKPDPTPVKPDPEPVKPDLAPVKPDPAPVKPIPTPVKPIPKPDKPPGGYVVRPTDPPPGRITDRGEVSVKPTKLLIYVKDTQGNLLPGYSIQIRGTVFPVSNPLERAETGGELQVILITPTGRKIPQNIDIRGDTLTKIFCVGGNYCP